ncbi:sulfatase-like hydrolase/transferase [Armatimonas sp.]|uniref:sulfatase-like hydrolase/transferase n=1 Tax=Armatimonas sp. TaxID=1872638 RepID=UPI00286B08C1|nr:sulfatase-like hydrolase/transferase [Armatimonas sp.]
MKQLLAALALGLLVLPALAQPAKPPRPNIIFVLCDDLGYGDISPFGQKRFRTPNLEKLATEGQKWTQHYASSPVCVPTRACLMLGKHTGHSPIRDHQFDRALPELAQAPTMASVLKSAGYATYSVGKWGIGGGKADMPAHPEKRGFDHWFGLYGHVDGHVHYPDAQHPIFDGTKDVTELYKDSYSTDLYTAKAKQYIAEQTKKNPKQPFFMYLAYIAPHAQYQVPDGPYPTEGVSLPLKLNSAQKNAWLDPTLPAEWTDWEKRYATMIRRLDDAMGDLTASLKKQGLDKNTLIVFTSDNGPSKDPQIFNSWGPLDGFKRDLYEGGMREPTILWGPGVVKPGEVSLPSAHYDWLATFAELAGVSAPKDTDGLSLAASVTGKGVQKPHDFLYWEFHGPSKQDTDKKILARHGYPNTGPDPWGEQQAVRIGDFVGLRVQIKDANTPLKLYNVVADVHQDKDLAGDPKHAALLAKMKALMAREHTPQPGNPRPYDIGARPAPPVPAASTTAGPGISVLMGNAYTPPDFTNQAASWFGSSVQASPAVELLISGLTPGKAHQLGISWWDWGGRGRKQRVRVSNPDGSGEATVISETELPGWKGKSQPPQELTVELPLGLSGAALRVFIDRITGPNALACELWIYEAGAKPSALIGPMPRLEQLRKAAPQGYELLFYKNLGDKETK